MSTTSCGQLKFNICIAFFCILSIASIVLLCFCPQSWYPYHFLSPNPEIHVLGNVLCLDLKRISSVFPAFNQILLVLNHRVHYFNQSPLCVQFIFSLYYVQFIVYENKSTCRVFIDLQKAFAAVDHGIHPSKLNHYNVRRTSYQVFQCFPVVQYFRE